MLELKPCPFCGSNDIEIAQEFSSMPFHLQCDCGCFLFTEAYSFADAALIWNYRKQVNTHDETLDLPF